MITTEFARDLEQGKAYCYHFKNKNGMEMTVTNYGAIITSIKAPDKNGAVEEVTLGFDSIDDYRHPHPYFGSTVGRVANRVRNGRFTLNGKEYQLSLNHGKHQLHGGVGGFHTKLWDAKLEDGDTLALTCVSPDGEEGYPGALTATVRFSLTDDNEVVLDYEAQSDADTILNLTNHAYFNLNGKMDSVMDHILTIYADRVTATDGELIQTGEIRDVTDTPMDFRAPRKIGERIKEDYDLLVGGNGYDTNYALNGEGMRKAAEVRDEGSGRRMEVYTDQPGVQLYTSQSLDPGIFGHGGKEYKPYCSFCLETQSFPDAVNHPNFPGMTLKKGDTYKTVTKYVFSAK